MPAFLACRLCGREAQHELLPDASRVACKACGKYVITGSVERSENFNADQRARIGFWVRDQNALGDEPRIDTTTAERVARLPEIPVIERIERLLHYAIAEQGGLGGAFSVHEPSAAGATHSKSVPEVAALSQALLDEGYVRTGQQGWLSVTPRGYIRAAEKAPTASQSAFIAMWFNDQMNQARFDGLEPAIRDAGYTPVIVSAVEHVGKIDDEIVSQIRKSKFLVADFTGHRGGVYFEAGFAMGLGLPVFWTCRKNEMADLHFDIRQYNCIDWTDPADLRARLRLRVEAVIGAGPVAASA